VATSPIGGQNFEDSPTREQLKREAMAPAAPAPQIAPGGPQGI
jgi:hypothetical protein